MWETVMGSLTAKTNYARGTTELADVHYTKGPIERGFDEAGKKEASVTVIAERTERPPLEGEVHSFWHRLRLFDTKYCTAKQFLAMSWRGVIMMRFPVILW